MDEHNRYYLTIFLKAFNKKTNGSLDVILYVSLWTVYITAIVCAIVGLLNPIYDNLLNGVTIASIVLLSSVSLMLLFLRCDMYSYIQVHNSYGACSSGIACAILGKEDY
jgi:hypothetical protein